MTLDDMPSTKHLAEINWYVGIESKCDRKADTTEMTQTRHIRSVLESSVSMFLGPAISLLFYPYISEL